MSGDGDYTVPDRDRMRRVARPESLAEVLDGLVRRRGWGERVRGGEVLRRWPEVVGDELAGHCEPVRISGGILVVRASSQAWATQLAYLRGRIRRGANEMLGEELVEEVQVCVGELEGTAGAGDADA